MFERKYIIAVLLLVLVVVLNLPVQASRRIKGVSRDTVAPFQNIMSLLIDDLRDAGTYLVNAGKAADERRRTQEELAGLRLQVQSLRSAEMENSELRRQLAFKQKQEFKVVAAEVVSRGDSSGWWQTVCINRGTDDGVRANMPVVSVDGLIGRVHEVSRHSADVLLITDPTCKVAAKFSRTGALGIVRGGGVLNSGKPRIEMLCAAQPCRMEYVSNEKKIIVDDEVVTSGLGGIYPEGLLIGRVVSIARDVSGLNQNVDIVPVAGLGDMRYVFVIITKETPGAAGAAPHQEL